MIPFETEFVVKIPDPNGFAAQVIAWLRGMKNSRVLDKASDADLDKDHASIRSSNGEALTLRVLRNCNTAEAIGFRHDIPEVERGRFWRTEAVIRWAGQASGEGLLRMRGTCLPLQVGADLDRPKKPYLIKSVLADGLGGNDDVLPVSAAPLLLPETDDGLDLAELALTGRANTYLPVVYISATDVARLSILPNDVSRFAFKLGGGGTCADRTQQGILI